MSIKETPECVPSLPPGEVTGRRWHLWTRKWALTSLLAPWPWISQSPELWEINFIVYKPLSLWYFAIAAWTDSDRGSMRWTWVLVVLGGYCLSSVFPFHAWNFFLLLILLTCGDFRPITRGQATDFTSNHNCIKANPYNASCFWYYSGCFYFSDQLWLMQGDRCCSRTHTVDSTVTICVKEFEGRVQATMRPYKYSALVQIREGGVRESPFEKVIF